MSQTSSQGASPGSGRKGRNKALLIAVRNVKGNKASLPRAHHDARELRELLIDQYDFAEDDIVMLLDDRKLEMSSWPSKRNILEKIKWLVEDLGEHDRLVFYYSGHGGQTTCRHGSHGSEVDGKDEAIYGYTGQKIIDNVMKQRLVVPVLKVKGCCLFALFDCCHSETILDLKHGNSCYRMLPPVVKSSVTSGHASGMNATQTPVPKNRWWLSKEYRFALPVSIAGQSKNVLAVSPWSIIRQANRTLGHVCNRIARMLNGFKLLKSTPPSVDEPVPASARRLSIDTKVSRSNSFMSPHRTVMSPISIFPNARCNSECVMTEEEENEGHVVCLSACKDDEMAFDDIEAGGTLTKFFISSLKKNSNIPYEGLLEEIRSQVTDLQAKRVAYMQRHPLRLSQRRKRKYEIRSESEMSLMRKKGSSQEPRISSNRPFDFTKKVSI